MSRINILIQGKKKKKVDLQNDMVMVNDTLQNEPSEIHGQDTEVRQVTYRLPIIRQNLQVFNESTVSVHNVGSMDNICSACGELMFQG